jgi:formylglycine-generating enzyme required for sulfatase activity
VALTKTTVGQYLEVMPGPDGLGLFRHANGCARPDDLRPELPISCVSYIDAIAFCRRLSELDGMSEDRMCYPPPDRIKLGMTPPDDAPTRTGWRLPTIDEWEYLARAGTVTDTFWGTDESIAPRYGWFGQPIGTRLKPIGWYRPNDLGINELFGNVYEWCSLPPDRDDAVCHLQPHGKQECDCGPLIAFRGGSLTTPPVYFKANPPVGRMNGMRTTISFEGTGFRIVRTLTPEEARTGPFAVISSVIPTPR